MEGAPDDEGKAGNQSASAYRYHYGLHIRQLLEYFQADGSLAGYHFGVVERMHEAVAVFLLQLQGAGIGIVVDARNKAHIGSIAFGGLNFGDWRSGGKADERADSAVGGAKGDTLCVVAGRAGNHPSGFLLVAELGNLVISSTKLERAGELEIFGFYIHLGAVAEFRSRNDRSEPGHIFQNAMLAQKIVS